MQRSGISTVKTNWGWAELANSLVSSGPGPQKGATAFVLMLQTVAQHGKLIKKIRFLCGGVLLFWGGVGRRKQEERGDDKSPLTRQARQCRHSWTRASFACLCVYLKGHCGFLGLPLKGLLTKLCGNQCESSLSWLKCQRRRPCRLSGRVVAPPQRWHLCL